MEAAPRLGILCGGGPAPGMNSVISAATIEAINCGWEVVGILDGFEHLIAGRTDRVTRLEIKDVSRIHLLGGTIILTSRANPTASAASMAACVDTIEKLRLDALITIGGDDTAYSAACLARDAADLHVVHVPKTIDNDIPLPGGAPTFGYETARHVGVHLINNLMTDAMTTRRWFFVIAMGRSAGHLALGIGKASGATLTVIAEEFPKNQPIRLDHLVDILETAMLKRMAQGRPFGVAILAEGLGLRLAKEDLEEFDLERDAHGHVRLAEIHLHRLLTDLVRDRFRRRGDSVTVVAKNLGYELRCAPPIPFDIEYTRDLGCGAVDTLRKLRSEATTSTGCMVTLQESRLVPMPFGAFADPDTGRPKVREVKVDSESYSVATRYMIRLERDDLENPDKLAPIAEAAKMTPEDFHLRYGYLVEHEETIVQS